MPLDLVWDNAVLPHRPTPVMPYDVLAAAWIDAVMLPVDVTAWWLTVVQRAVRGPPVL